MYKIAFKFEDNNNAYGLKQLGELASHNWNDFKWDHVAAGDLISTFSFTEVYHDFKVKLIDHENKRVVLTDKIY